MAVNEDLIKSVETLGYNYEKLNDSVKVRLKKIYRYRQEIIESIKSSEEDIQENSFSISRVAHKLGCSRTTIYNNLVVKDYIEAINKEIEWLNPYTKIKTLEEDICELNEKINLMKLRDIEIELLRLDNIELKEKIEKDNPKNIYNINNK